MDCYYLLHKAVLGLREIKLIMDAISGLRKHQPMLLVPGGGVWGLGPLVQSLRVALLCSLSSWGVFRCWGRL